MIGSKAGTAPLRVLTEDESGAVGSGAVGGDAQRGSPSERPRQSRATSGFLEGRVRCAQDRAYGSTCVKMPDFGCFENFVHGMNCPGESLEAGTQTSAKTKNDPLAKVVRVICSSKAVLVGDTGFEPVTSSV